MLAFPCTGHATQQIYKCIYIRLFEYILIRPRVIPSIPTSKPGHQPLRKTLMQNTRRNVADLWYPLNSSRTSRPSLFSRRYKSLGTQQARGHSPNTVLPVSSNNHIHVYIWPGISTRGLGRSVSRPNLQLELRGLSVLGVDKHWRVRRRSRLLRKRIVSRSCS